MGKSDLSTFLADRSQARAAQAAAYAFIATMACDLADFEEATGPLFAGDSGRFAEHSRGCPPDIRSYAATLMTSEIAKPQQGDSTDADLP
jgi:uncharacterized protein